jgi:hypothetical protein
MNSHHISKTEIMRKTDSSNNKEIENAIKTMEPSTSPKSKK